MIDNRDKVWSELRYWKKLSREDPSKYAVQATVQSTMTYAIIKIVM